MRRRVYFYEYECDECHKKVRKTQTNDRFRAPQEWDRRAIDGNIYLYCEACK